MDDLRGYVFRSLSWSPLYAVYFVGLILSVVRWRLHPRISLLASLGFGIHLVRLITGPLAYTLVFRQLLESQQLSIEQAQTTMLAFNFVDALVAATAWALLLVPFLGDGPTSPSFSRTSARCCRLFSPLRGQTQGRTPQFSQRSRRGH